MKNYSLIIIFVAFTALQAFSTHNRAGEITYRHLGNCVYEITMTTYTYTLSQADRPQLEVSWGDNTSTLVDRVSKTQLPNEFYYKNVYKGQHTYPGPGVYKMTMLDENRNYGVDNIPNSVMVPFTLQTIIKVNCGFINQAPILLYPPIDKAKVGVVFIHNPSAWDPDGDSLSYALTVCLGDNGLPIPGYSLPYASNDIWVDAVTGDLIWDSPIQPGIVNVAMMIEEWRKINGVPTKIGQILRDIQIEIFESNNNPPVISPLTDLCVVAGTHVQFSVSAADAENNRITLSATGGPFEVADSPALFDTVVGVGFVTNLFRWQTNCSHVRHQPYHLLFRARDDNYQLSLVDLSNMYITVVAPKPDNLAVLPTSNSINLTWDPSICTNAMGYDIYRKTGASGWTPANCELGVPAYTGFIKIASNTGQTNTSFLDNENGLGLALGFEYCYRVVARFVDGAESYSSDEVCTELVKGVPAITHVSVLRTETPNGKIYVEWSKPTDFDSIAAPGPYKYVIYRSDDFWGQNFSVVDSLDQINDTIFYDSLLNTASNPSSYRIDFYNDELGNRFLIGQPHVASSIFLNAIPDDERVILNINFNVPWINYRYDIFRYNNSTSQFDSIGTTVYREYIDSNLINNTTYCYKVRSCGHYISGSFVDPLYNWSQELCIEPADTTAPCQPPLTVSSNCGQFLNTLTWRNPNHFCANDVVAYKVYYTPILNGTYQLLATIQNVNDTFYVHNSPTGLAGCYYVSAVDSFFNESALVTSYCIDDCQYYELPNIFSPDNEGTNDFYKPGPYYFVEKVDMKIFNRWGKLVFQTENPDIMWDGKDMDSKKSCTEGVYYYLCDVYEQRLTGIEIRTITGFIELVRIIKTDNQ